MSRLSALDGLRGYAALMVVFFHSILEIKPNILEDVLKKPIYALHHTQDVVIKIALLLLNGHAAVALFFVLSGAVLMRALQKSAEVKKTISLLWTFSIQRFFRIYPALMLCLITVYSISNILFSCFPGVFHDQFSVRQFWQNVFLFSTPVHGASWTLQAEMMAIPFVCFTFFLLKSDRFFGLFFVLTVLYGALFAVYQPIGFVCFSLGFILISSPLRRFFCALPPATVFFFLFFTLAIEHVFPEGRNFLIKGLRWILQGIFACGLVGVVYHQHRGLFIKWLNYPLSQYFGRISYSLYLFNVVGLHPLISLAHYYFPQHCHQYPVMMGFSVGLVLSLLTIPIAHICYKYLEKPGIKIGKRMVSGSAHMGEWLIRPLKFLKNYE